MKKEIVLVTSSLVLGMLTLRGADGMNAKPAAGLPAPTAGSVKIEFATQQTRDPFAPQHVLAVWVENARGEHVKTLQAYGKKYGRYLVAWQKAIGAQEIKAADAITGATLKAHKAHEMAWDCRDAGGAIVPNGIYEICIEFSEKNGKGPICRMKFNKENKPVTLQPPAKAFFKQLKLVYTPDAGVK